jgi:hypothetical protein
MSVKSFSPAQDYRWLAMLLLAIIGFVIVGLGIWYSQLPIAKSRNVETISQAIGTANHATVMLKLGATRLELDGAAFGLNLIEGQVETLDGIETLKKQSQVADNKILYSIEAKRPAAIKEQAKWSVWYLHLSPRIPLELTVTGGIADSELNLRLLNLTTLNLNPEFANYAVSLPQQGSSRVTMKGGMGRSVINVLKSTALRIKVVDFSAGRVEMDGRILRNGTVMTEANFETAKNKVDLEITTGFGHVAIMRGY